MLNITIGVDIYVNTVLTEDLENLTEKNITLELLETDNNIKNTVDYKIAANDKASKELL